MSPVSAGQGPLLDEFLPVWDVRERHATAIEAAADTVFGALLTLDLGRSPVIRWLFRLRGLPASMLNLEGLERHGFNRLAQRPGRELVLGIAGRFWTPGGDLQRLAPEAFRAFDRRGFAKAVWSFEIRDRSATGVEVTTETRVQCLPGAGAFRLYWLGVRPFSGWVRREMLRLLKSAAEAAR